MTIASGLPRPKLYVIPDGDPNAFATGRDPERASIAVTKGLLESLNREELQGVVAHELSHVRNYDMRLMTVVAAMVGAIALLADWSIRVTQFGGGGRKGSRSRDGGGGGGGLGAVVFVVWIVGIILAPVIGQMLAMLVSRNREYLADASAAEMTRNPLALAAALEKIEAAADPTPSIKRGTANLCIADPLARPVGRKRGAGPTCSPRTRPWSTGSPPCARWPTRRGSISRSTPTPQHLYTPTAPRPPAPAPPASSRSASRTRGSTQTAARPAPGGSPAPPPRPRPLPAIPLPWPR